MVLNLFHIGLFLIFFIFSGCTKNDLEKNRIYVNEKTLHVAARTNDEKLLMTLIKEKRDLNKKDEFGYSALHLAAKFNHFNICKLLIQNQAKLNTKDIHGDTALIDAVKDNSLYISRLLICNKADINLKNNLGLTALDYALKNNNKQILYLLDSNNLNNICNFKKKVEIKTKKIEYKKNLIKDLRTELNEVLANNSIEFDEDNLTFRFKNTSVLYKRGKSEINEEFERILDEFTPKFMKVLNEYKSIILSINIEGHTSSRYKSVKTEKEKFEKNKILSQKRADNVLNYVKAKIIRKIRYNYLSKLFKAEGKSSSNLLFDDKGLEDVQDSRRIEFKIEIKS